MNDIEQPRFYDAQNIDQVIHDIHKAGFYNLSQLVKQQFEKIKELEIEIEETRETASEQGYNEGYDAAKEDGSPGAEEFASWFLNDFERESARKIKFKKIKDTTFVIMLETDYEDLKSQFHKMCD